MSYQVLARKWRPQTWDDLLAQEHVTRTLRNAIETGRLAHAYLFSGPRGVGKTSAARILAKALNCENGPTPDPCNKCSACIEISEGRNVDVLEIDGASNNGVDEVRNLRENVRYAPAQGRSKIYIIDEVHMLTVQAFNALLKTLEEPPDNVLFIFATTEPHKIPPTIISRCQRFDFRRIPVKDIVENLNRICTDEKIQIDKDALEIIALKGDGSLRDSQSLLDQMISYHTERITAEHVIEGLGLIAQEKFFDLTDAIYTNNMVKGFDVVEDIIKNGYDVGEFVSGLIVHFRNILIAGSAGKEALVDVPESSKPVYMEESKKFSHGDIFRLLKIVDDLQQKIKRNPQKRVVLEMAVAKMVKMDSTVTIENLISGLGASSVNTGKDSYPTRKAEPVLKEKPQDTYLKPEVSSEDKSDEETDISAEKKSPDEELKSIPRQDQDVLDYELVKSKWNDVIQEIKHRTITVGSFLHDGILSRVENRTIELEFHESNWFHIDAIMRSKSIVEEVLANVFGAGAKFRCIKTSETNTHTVSYEDEKKNKLSEMVKSNEVLKKIVDEFETDIAG